MLPVNPPTPTSSNNISRVYRESLHPEDQDIWFDAIDHVEMEEAWFDASEEHHASPSSSAGEAAESRVPFTEDCRRGVQQFVRTLGEYGESRMLSACLSKILPGTPASLVLAANSLYTAVTERRNIDTAALHALGLASGYLPENINVVSRLASFIRDTVSGWTDETFLQHLMGNEENQTSIHLFTALAITAIVAGRWMKDEGAPQRGVLKVPAFMANIFIRASHYWAALGNMAGSLPSGAEIPENTGTSQRAPAFEVDTQIEMTGDVCDATASGTSAPRLTAFSSNSTASPEAYTRATVQNRPAPATRENTHLSAPEQAHYLAVNKLRQESGLSDLLYCTNLKTETRQQTNKKVITNTYFNTKCDATVYPETLTKEADSLPVHTDIPETQVSSAATSRSVGEPLLPIVMTMTTATIPVATPYLQALKSKTAIVAGASMGLFGLTVGGKALWNRFRTLEPEAPEGNLAGDKSRDVSSSDNVALQNEALIKSAVPQLDSGGSLEDSFGNHSLQHHDVMENRIRHRVRHVRIDSPKEQTQLPALEDVKIGKQDYLCIEERQHLSIAQILRQIGRTLQNPITELAKEVQVINSVYNLERCPTKGDVEKIEHITRFVDKVVSATAMLLPHAKPLAILQSVGGPLFKLMADDIDQNGKIEDMQEIAGQVIFLSKSIAEKNAGGNKSKDSDAKISLPKDISFHKGRVYTQINGDRWELSYRKERFFARRENVEKEVEYSTKEDKWILGRNTEEINTEDVSLDENLVFSKEETERVISELAVDAEHFERIKYIGDTELYRVTLSDGRIYNCIKTNGKFLPFRALSLRGDYFEVYNIKKPRKIGYSIFISGDNKFHLGKRVSLSMKRGVKSIPYASNKLKKAIPSSYYIKNLERANLTPITSSGIVKSADNKKYILLEKGYVQIERHPILPKVYQLGPGDRDKILCYYDREANKFFSIPEERSISGQMAGGRGRGGDDHPYSQENILKYQFEKQKKLNNYRDGFRANNFNDYKIIKGIDVQVINRVNRVYLYGLNDEEVSHSIKYKKAALKIRRDIGSANMMIERVKESLLNIEHPNHVTNSFHKIFDIKPYTTESGKLIELFFNRLDATKKILERYISDDFINIWLVNHNDNGIIAETWKGDPLRRMYINIKKTNAYEKQNAIRRFFMKSSSKDDVPTVIHEASHQGADTVDSFYMGNASLENEISRLKSGEMKPREIKAILDSDEAIALPFSLKTEKEIATDLFNKNPYVRAKLLLNNADSFSALVTELFSDMQKMHKREIISQHFENPEIIYLLFALALE